MVVVVAFQLIQLITARSDCNEIVQFKTKNEGLGNGMRWCGTQRSRETILINRILKPRSYICEFGVLHLIFT